jgi:hypothetical protein
MDYKEWIDAIDKRVEQARRDYKGPHCCLAMDIHLSKKGTILRYDEQYREYTIGFPNGGVLIGYCMFCGKKLSTSVRDEWFDILEKEYGLEEPLHEDKKKVPKEFWTDEWWKKRGL